MQALRAQACTSKVCTAGTVSADPKNYVRKGSRALPREFSMSLGCVLWTKDKVSVEQATSLQACHEHSYACLFGHSPLSIPSMQHDKHKH